MKRLTSWYRLLHRARQTGLLLPVLILIGCATSTIDTRRQERLPAYTSLSADQKDLVDRGQIKVGMSADAVYIAWGAPAEVLEHETAQARLTTWIYHGQWMEESRYWTFREVSQDGTIFLERHLETDYFPRNYIRAEIIFENGQVKSWRTLPRPVP